MTKGKVLIIVGDATETVDTLYPYYRLIEGGFEPVVAAPEKRRYQMVLHEVKPGWTITKEWEGYSIMADIAFKDIKPEEYLGIFFSGGRAPEYIREDEDLLRITRWYFDNNKPCASVCHGVEIPARAGPGARTAHGHGGQVQVRPRGLRRHLRERAVRGGRQPRQRPHLSRQRALREALDRAARQRGGECQVICRRMQRRLQNLALMALAALGSSAIPRAHAHPLMADPVEYPLVPGFDRFFAPEDDEAHLADGGVLLLGELRCVSCHAAPETWQDRMPARAKLSLGGVGSRLSADDIWLFARSPQHRKKGTTMPGLFSGAERDDTALEAITQYLSSLKEPVKKYPEGDVERGRKLYHTIGCVACHEPAKIEDYRPAEAPPDVAVEQPGLPSVPVLFADRYDRDALVAFLLDPLKVRRDGRMPSTQMTEQEAADVAAYLQINREPLNAQERAALKIKAPGGDEGRKGFERMNCIACHEVPQAGPAMGSIASRPLISLQADQGCLSAQKKAGVPDYGLNDFQIRALRLALAKLKAEAAPAPLTAAAKCDAFFTRMNCYACHEFAGKGGLEEPRAQYFTVNDATVHSLGELGRLPPKLDAAGRKLTQAWFEKLLWGEDGGVRPYMTGRMPRFGEENAAPIIPLMSEACAAQKEVKIDTSGLAKHHRAELGRVLMGVGQGGMGCVSCHGLKDRKALGVAMINLTHTVQRIRPEYFKELLLNPQATQLGTLMPPLFMGRKKADLEVEEIWTYLKEIDGSRLPEGLLQTGDYELKPEQENRPVVFRTFLEGAGMAAVAVGFPQRIHVAFDALETRWALVWRGRFVDAMTTWEERAMTPAKPLGEKVRALSGHMPLAKLASASDAWPEAFGGAAGYVLKGYRLDKDGVPVFLYEVNGLSVEDVMRPDAGGNFLRRTVTVNAEPGGGEVTRGWMFRGLGPGAKPAPLVWKNSVAVIEEEVRP